MRRAMASIDGVACEVRLRNISVMGALVECDRAVGAHQVGRELRAAVGRDPL